VRHLPSTGGAPVNGDRAPTEQEWGPVRRWLLALAVVAPICGASCAPDGNVDVAAVTVVTTPEPADGDVGAGAAAPSSAPVVVTEPAPGTPCGRAADVIEHDVAVRLAADQERTDAEAALRSKLGESLDLLADGDGELAEAAAAIDVVGSPTDDAPDTAADLDAAMRDECTLRLSGLGTLGAPAGDPLDGTGLAVLDGDLCERAGPLRWADTAWRLAPDGGERDRMAVLVRQGLGSLRLLDEAERSVELDLPDDVERADLSGGALSADQRIAMVRLDADLQRDCGGGFEFGGLLLEGSRAPSEADLATLAEPDWVAERPRVGGASNDHWCGVADALYGADVAAVMNEAYGFDGTGAIALRIRLMLGALRVSARWGGSVRTLDDVRDVIAATTVLERADLSATGLLTDDEHRAVVQLDRLMAANCGVGFRRGFGMLGWYTARPVAGEPVVTTSTTLPPAGASTTTSTTLAARLAPADVAVVGDSLTLSAQQEVTDTLGRLGLGVVRVDGQVSRRMTSATDTIRSGLSVVQEIAASSNPQVWVIALGTNDVASGVPADSLSRSVRQVLDAIPPGAMVVWVDTWLRDEFDAVVAGNQIIREAVESRPNSVVADFFSYGDDEGIVGSDGVHLTTAGRRLFANVMANGIAAVLDGEPAPVPVTTPPSTPPPPTTA
jgi:lysophospholipase L1-like esterase